MFQKQVTLSLQNDFFIYIFYFHYFLVFLIELNFYWSFLVSKMERQVGWNEMDLWKGEYQITWLHWIHLKLKFYHRSVSCQSQVIARFVIIQLFIGVVFLYALITNDLDSLLRLGRLMTIGVIAIWLWIKFDNSKQIANRHQQNIWSPIGDS